MRRRATINSASLAQKSGLVRAKLAKDRDQLGTLRHLLLAWIQCEEEEEEEQEGGWGEARHYIPP